VLWFQSCLCFRLLLFRWVIHAPFISFFLM
jgi:hypothetical protein